MARKRDIVVAVIIIISVFITLGFFGLLFIGGLTSEGDIYVGGSGSRVAVVEVEGTIYDSEDAVRQLKRWGKSGVKAIVLHVNSPGGGVAASQEIYDEIKRIREEEGKIVVASMSSVAASGGYYISCATDKIMADAGTITGSIGVIMQYYVAGKLMEKIGIDMETVKSGELKDVGSWNRRMTEKENEMLTKVIMDSYDQFVDVVVEGRGLPREQVYELANGSIFTGRQALRHGLVDTLGGYEAAVRYAAELAGIEGEPRVIKEPEPKPGLFDLLGSTLGQVKDMATGEISGPRLMYLY